MHTPIAQQQGQQQRVSRLQSMVVTDQAPRREAFASPAYELVINIQGWCLCSLDACQHWADLCQP